MRADSRDEKPSEDFMPAADNDRLKSLIGEGIVSGPGIPAEEIFAVLRRTYTAPPSE